MMLYDSISLMKPVEIRQLNLQSLIDKDGLTTFSKRVKKPASQINDMLAGRKAFGEKVARQIEKSYAPNQPSGWLDVEDEVDLLRSIIHEDTTSIRIPNAQFLLTDDGKYAISTESYDANPFLLSSEWIIKNGINHDDLYSILVPDNSMETSLYAGDSIVVDVDDKKQVDGLVYTFNFEGTLKIRRLKRDAGAWWLSADNGDKRRYHDNQLHDGVTIIGRVIYKMSEKI